MHPTTDADKRLSDFLVAARAVVLATVVLTAGAVSHVLGDGLLPAPGAMLVLFVLTAVGSAFFLQRPAGVVRLLLLVIGGQSVIHLALSVTAGHGGDVEPVAATPTVTPAAGQGLHEVYLAQQDAIWSAGNTAPDPLLHLLSHVVEAGPMMIAAHTAAAAVVALWLAVGEHALAALLALTARNIADALRALGHFVPVRATHLRPVVPAAPAWLAPTRTGEVVRRAISRRGPPLLTA